MSCMLLHNDGKFSIWKKLFFCRKYFYKVIVNHKIIVKSCGSIYVICGSSVTIAKDEVNILKFELFSAWHHLLCLYSCQNKEEQFVLIWISIGCCLLNVTHALYVFNSKQMITSISTNIEFDWKLDCFTNKDQ